MGLQKHCKAQRQIRAFKMSTKILVAGIGGVGGYFGGLLAQEYAQNNSVEIYFLARGAHLNAIRQNGLTITQGNTTFTVHPKLASDNANDFGKVDYVLLCTKAYDLNAVLLQIAPCVNEHTVILPLLNGVSHVEQIQSVYPNNLVLNGCVYIVARLTAPGSIANTGNIQRFFMGVDDTNEPKAEALFHMVEQAGIDAHFSKNISRVVWEKFIFLSPIASLTSYYNASIGQILQDPEKTATLNALVDEVIALAHAKNINLPNDIKATTLKKYGALPFDTTSSMHSDFAAKKPFTEVDTLCGYVVYEGSRLNMPVENYKSIYSKLKA